MTKDDIGRTALPVQVAEPGPTDMEQVPPKQKALALGLEFSKRALEAESLDELFFILTNDIRALVEFDRALLVTHFGGKSSFVAASNQPILQAKHKFVKEVNALAEHLSGIERGILLSSEAEAGKLSEDELPSIAREHLLSYMKFSSCSYLLCVPLKYNKDLLGHLLLEFHENTLPGQIEILAVLSIAPLFASALAEKWLFQQKPGLRGLISTQRESRHRLRPKTFAAAAVLSLLLVAVFFLLPVDHTVGGEAEVAPRDKHMAFVKIDGLVDQINVKEDSRVEKGQVLAVLDKKELEHEIKTAERKFEVLTNEMILLRRESGQDPAKLAESKVAELKRKSAWEELEYLKWKTRFLEVKSPVSGVVVTKEIDALVGKKFKAGEPFCEIAAPGELWVTAYVPEDRISPVKKGQPATVYLNNQPGKAYHLKVEEIAPVAQVMPRLGNVYRVRASFVEPPKDLKVGMKGIGKITTERTSLYSIVGRRLLARWNQLSIHF